jgi:hypothetical protein
VMNVAMVRLLLGATRVGHELHVAPPYERRACARGPRVGKLE